MLTQILVAVLVVSVAVMVASDLARTKTEGPLGQPDAAALAVAGLEDPVGQELPPVRPSAYSRPLRGEVAARLGTAPIPVVLGAADSVLGAMGLGVREPGQVAYIAGTSTVILGITDRLVLDPAHRFLVTPLAEPGRWGVEMDGRASMRAVVFYESADDVATRARPHFAAHCARWQEFADRGELLMIGTFANAQEDGSMAIFSTRAAAEAFVRDDPFVLNGVVRNWTIRDWNEALVPE